MSEALAPSAGATPAAGQPPPQPSGETAPKSDEALVREALNEAERVEAPAEEAKPTPEERASETPETEKDWREREEPFEEPAEKLSESTLQLLKEHPELNKPVRGYQAYKEVGEISEFRRLKEIFPDAEAAEQSVETAEGFRMLDELYRSGDPEFFARLYDGSKEGYEQMVPGILEDAARRAPEVYRNVNATLFEANLKSMIRLAKSRGDSLNLDHFAETYRQFFGKEPDESEPRIREPKRPENRPDRTEEFAQAADAMIDDVGSQLSDMVDEKVMSLVKDAGYTDKQLRLILDSVNFDINEALSKSEAARVARQNVENLIRSGRYVSPGQLRDLVSKVWYYARPHLNRALQEAQEPFAAAKVGAAKTREAKQAQTASRREPSSSGGSAPRVPASGPKWDPNKSEIDNVLDAMTS